MILKIQLLRLVHNFCSHSAYKHVLLSYSEMDELKQLYLAFDSGPAATAAAMMTALTRDVSGSSPSSVSSCVGTSVHEPLLLLTGLPGGGIPSPSTSTAGPPVSLPYCTGSAGLLSRIIRVLKNVPTSSIFRYASLVSTALMHPDSCIFIRHIVLVGRFWLCRAVESWLRSSSHYGMADQLFVIGRGLLQHIVHVLLESESLTTSSGGGDPPMPGGGRNSNNNSNNNNNNSSNGGGPPREVAQSSFDLLGEMIRFNMEACRQLDLLLATQSKVSRYLEVVHSNLIDSNMFLRSVFLTMDHCMEGGGQGTGCGPGGAGSRYQQAAVFFPTSKFFSWFLHLRRRVCYLALLVSSISVDTVTIVYFSICRID